MVGEIALVDIELSANRDFALQSPQLAVPIGLGFPENDPGSFTFIFDGSQINARGGPVLASVVERNNSREGDLDVHDVGIANGDLVDTALLGPGIVAAVFFIFAKVP
jgi:hypothetical protein